MFTPRVRMRCLMWLGLLAGLSFCALWNGYPEMTGKDLRVGQGRTSSNLNNSEIFSEMAVPAGIRFTHYNGATRNMYMPETVGSGAALFDCDNDGKLDLFVVQGNLLGSDKTLADTRTRSQTSLSLGRLYHNDTVIDADGSRTLRFTDITDRSGIDAQDYGKGLRLPIMITTVGLTCTSRHSVTLTCTATEEIAPSRTLQRKQAPMYLGGRSLPLL